MHIVFLSPGRISGRKSGQPSVWLEQRLHEPACQWLNEEIVPRTQSPNTWAQAARALVSWLDFCLEVGVNWRHANRDDLIAYRDAYLEAISPVTGRPYSPNTVRTRMSYILEFIDYAHAQGWHEDGIAGVALAKPLTTISRRPLDCDALAHTRKGSAPRGARPSRTLLPKATQDETVRMLRREELNALLGWAGPRPSGRAEGDGSGCDRDRIVFDFGWAVGLRVDEIRSLTIYPFERMVPDQQHPGEWFKIFVKGKGRKTRQVDVPAWLVIDTQAYINGDRKRALARRGKNAHESQLLLNSENSRSRPGFPMTIAGMDALIARACEGAGLMRRVERTNPETGEVAVVSKTAFSMHCLRHTYAAMTYHNLKASGIDDFERWKYIQMQLGHSSPKTTIDIYLKHVNAWPNIRATRTLLELVGV